MRLIAQGLQGITVKVTQAVARVKAEGAQDAQAVFTDPVRRRADKAGVPGFEVFKTAKVVVEVTVPVQRHGVVGEITARGVFPPVGGESNRGVAAVGLDITA